MNCLSNDIIQSYIDNELSISELDAVNSHLLQCEKCQVKLNERENDVQLLKSNLASLNPGSVKLSEFIYPKVTSQKP